MHGNEPSAFMTLVIDDGSKTPTPPPSTLTKAIDRLKHDHDKLSAKLLKLRPIFGDATVEEHVNAINSILEKAIHDVMQIVDASGQPVWRLAMVQLRERLAEYRQLLDNVKGRRELKEAQESCDQLSALLQHLLAGNRDVDEIKERITCCVCQEEQVNVSIACGHLLCATCTQSVDKCPICRHVIEPQAVRPVYW